MSSTTGLQRLLDLARQGESDQRDRIVSHSCERLRSLARRMLRGHPDVKRWVETDDVLQGALIRLLRALAEVRPATAPEFFALATTQIRRELIDLARHYHGPRGVGANHHTDGGVATLLAESPPSEPASLDDWTRFHTEVGRLAEPQRRIVELLWYGGLNQAEAAQLLGMSLATLKRHWQAARLALFDVLNDEETS